MSRLSRFSEYFTTRVSSFVLPHVKHVIPAFFHTPAIPGSYKQTFSGKQLTVRQIRKKSLWRSDHRGLLIDLGNKCYVLNKNGMMHCKPHNNGYGKKESKKAYRLRLIRAIIEDYLDIQKYPGIVAITRQEFAIEPDDIALAKKIMEKFNISGWENPVFHLSDFGVMTCFKNGEVANAFYRDSTFESSLGIYKSRCQKFTANDRYSFFNTHIPHETAAKSFKKIMHAALKNQLDGITENDLRCADFIGDKNLEPGDQVAITKKIVEKMNHERMAAGQKPIAVLSYLASSPNGHRQVNKDGEIIHTNVDSAHRLLIALADKPNFEHIEETVEELSDSRWKYLFGVVFGGSFVISNMISDEVVADIALARLVLRAIETRFDVHQHFPMNADVIPLKSFYETHLAK